MSGSLHVESWAGKPSQPEDAFVATVAEMARRQGSRLCLRLVSEIEALTSARQRWAPSTVPSVAHLGPCLGRGPDTTAYLRGAVAALRDKLPWERAPKETGFGKFTRQHAFCTIVGPAARIPSDRMALGLFMIDAHVHYPTHSHSADELYLPLSGTAAYRVGNARPSVEDGGRFLSIPSWTPHAMWTADRSVLIVWAWMGDLKGGYVAGSVRLTPEV